MPTYSTPGVYYERVDAMASAITAIRTDVAGFVGLAERGPLDMPVPVESWRQFQAHFGNFTGTGFLAYAVRGFFENGGKRCWIVRVASRELTGGASPASLELTSSVAGRLAWRVEASSPGTWGNRLGVTVTETHRAQTTGRLDRDHPERLRVASVTGMERGTLVRLSQTGKPSALRVIAEIDTTGAFATGSSDSQSFLRWVPEGPGLALPYDTAALDFVFERTIHVESVEYTLGVDLDGAPIALYRDLSLIPEHPNYGPTMLAPFRVPDDVEARRVLPPLPQPVTLVELRKEFMDDALTSERPLETMQAPTARELLGGGTSGLRLLSAFDFIGEAVDANASDTVKLAATRGVRALADVDEVSMLAIPDIHVQPVTLPPTEPPPVCIPDPCLPTTGANAASRIQEDTELPPVFSDADIYRVQAAMIEQCEETRSRVALLDPPFPTASDSRLGIGAVELWRRQFDTSYAASYFPWLRVLDPLRSRTAVTRDIPPSGHVAGQYARTDLEIGVHKAPANYPLSWVQDVTIPVDDSQHGVLNPLGISAIRPLPGRGIRIFGARTVSSDPDWRFISIRRLMIMIVRAIDRSTQWAVFEGNDAITREKLRLSLSSFLLSLWQKGALAGSTREAAFFVRCDETTNPAWQQDEGQLLALVGVAPVNPFEFVVVRVGRTANMLEIIEQQALEVS